MLLIVQVVLRMMVIMRTCFSRLSGEKKLRLVDAQSVIDH